MPLTLHRFNSLDLSHGNFQHAFLRRSRRKSEDLDITMRDRWTREREARLKWKQVHDSQQRKNSMKLDEEDAEQIGGNSDSVQEINQKLISTTDSTASDHYKDDNTKDRGEHGDKNNMTILRQSGHCHCHDSGAPGGSNNSENNNNKPRSQTSSDENDGEKNLMMKKVGTYYKRVVKDMQGHVPTSWKKPPISWKPPTIATRSKSLNRPTDYLHYDGPKKPTTTTTMATADIP